MCGRIALYEEPDHLARMLNAGVSPDLLEGFRPRWNIAPTSAILGAYDHRDGNRELTLFKWGLVPRWAKNPAESKSAFNARAETLATKPMFRSAFRSSRILIPVDAFYEWETVAPKVKQPYAFRRADGEPTVFAGLREWWRDAEGRELILRPLSRPRRVRTCRYTIASPSSSKRKRGTSGSIPRSPRWRSCCHSWCRR